MTERTRTTAQLMFSDPDVLAKSYKPSIQDAATHFANHEGWSDAELDQHLRAVAVFFNDVGIQPQHIGGIYGAMVGDAIAPPDAATAKRQVAESRARLRGRDGSIDEGTRRLERVNAVLQKHPALGRLAKTNNPEVVLRLAERMGWKP